MKDMAQGLNEQGTFSLGQIGRFDIMKKDVSCEHKYWISVCSHSCFVLGNALGENKIHSSQGVSGDV
jgi:hypothetical protein